MKKRLILWIIYIALLILVTVNVSKHGGAYSYALFYVVLSYPFLALIYILYTIVALNIYQETQNRIIYKNKPQNYELNIENGLHLPLGHIRLIYDANVTHFKDDFTKDELKLLSRERIDISTELTCSFAGGYDAGITDYCVQDFLGLFSIKKKVGVPVRLHVLPIITDIAHGDIKKMSYEMAEGSRFTLSQKENFLGNDVRKYEEGDSLNTIHWKHYARTGDMYVRLPDNQESGMLTIVLVTEEIDSSLEKMKLRDEFFEYLISIAEYFGSRKKPVMFCYYNKGVKTFIIDGLESFHKFYTYTLTEIGSKAFAGHKEELAEEISGKQSNIIILEESKCRLEKL